MHSVLRHKVLRPFLYSCKFAVLTVCIMLIKSTTGQFHCKVCILIQVGGSAMCRCIDLTIACLLSTKMIYIGNITCGNIVTDNGVAACFAQNFEIIKQ